MITWTLPMLLYTEILPSTPTRTSRSLATASAPGQFSDEVPGLGTPLGNSVKNEGFVPPTTVTFKNRAVAEVGIPWVPKIEISTVSPPVNGPTMPMSLRVSTTRTGTIAVVDIDD